MGTFSPARITAAVVVIAAALVPACTVSASSRHQPSRGLAEPPNVMVILIDDATAEDVETMPNVQSLLVDQGITFTRAYSPFPLCCPARATILTGRYPHNHGVLDNVRPLGGFSKFDDSSTIATWLDPIYATGLFGKYLNDKLADRYVPPGWDTWKSPTEAATYNYLDVVENVNGTIIDFPGSFGTELYAKQARAFVGNQTGPWFAYVSFVAPHGGLPREVPGDIPSPYVAPDKQGTVPDVLPDDPSVNEADVSDKPQAVASLPSLTDPHLAEIADRVSQRREALASVDDEVGKLVAKVEAMGELDSTYFVFASDNGMLQGQHRIAAGKENAYEPASHVPLIIRGPGFPAGSTYDRVVGLQDVAPTVLSMTGLHSDGAFRPDGVSLLRLVTGSLPPLERPIVLEISENADVPDTAVETVLSSAERRRLNDAGWAVLGVVTSDGWKLIDHVGTGEIEVYDLTADPFELDNVAGSNTYQRDRLLGLLAQYGDCVGLGCR